VLSILCVCGRTSSCLEDKTKVYIKLSTHYMIYKSEINHFVSYICCLDILHSSKLETELCRLTLYTLFYIKFDFVFQSSHLIEKISLF